MRAEPGVAAELVRLCAGLPIAIVITAARAASRPGFALAALAAELRDTRTRLDLLAIPGEATMDLRAILSWSCQQLSGPAAELFLLLGAHQGPDISAAAAARLAGITHTRARHLLAELAGVSLLTEHAPDRFTFNDLLRAYAAERALADRRPRLSRSGQGSRGS